jgi:hypothetical protein
VDEEEHLALAFVDVVHAPPVTDLQETAAEGKGLTIHPRRCREARLCG